MPLPTSRELREMLEGATPGPWEFDFANLRWDERPASTVFWVSGDGPLDIAQRDAQSENRDQTEQNFTLIALAPQLAEEVIRLREEIDRLKSHLPRTRRPGALVEDRTRTTANPRRPQA